jgi:hypothetical protein
MWFEKIGLCVALPLALAAEMFAIYAGLTLWDQGVMRGDLWVYSGLAAVASLAALFVGYTLRDY